MNFLVKTKENPNGVIFFGRSVREAANKLITLNSALSNFFNEISDNNISISVNTKLHSIANFIEYLIEHKEATVQVIE